jgi:hypothetical protein
MIVLDRAFKKSNWRKALVVQAAWIFLHVIFRRRTRTGVRLLLASRDLKALQASREPANHARLIERLIKTAYQDRNASWFNPFQKKLPAHIDLGKQDKVGGLDQITPLTPSQLAKGGPLGRGEKWQVSEP